MGAIATLVEKMIREGKKGREIVAAVSAIEDKRETDPAVLFLIRQAFEDWNAMARQLGLPEATTLTKPRVAKLRQRLAEAGGLEGWRTALTRLGSSPFLIGDNDRGFRADLDFVLQAKSFTKLREGAYDRSTVPRPRQLTRVEQLQEDLRQRIKNEQQQVERDAARGADLAIDQRLPRLALVDYAGRH